MIAIVKQNIGGVVKAIVRRNFRLETLMGIHTDLKVGDRVEVKRQTNNPYLIRVMRDDREGERRAEQRMEDACGGFCD